MFSTVITDGYSIGDFGMAVNISKLSEKYRRIYFVGNSNGKYRRNISISDCGMGGNFFATLDKNTHDLVPNNTQNKEHQKVIIIKKNKKIQDKKRKIPTF